MDAGPPFAWLFWDEIVCIACVYPALKDVLHSLYKAFLDSIPVMVRNLLEESCPGPVRAKDVSRKQSAHVKGE